MSDVTAFTEEVKKWYSFRHLLYFTADGTKRAVWCGKLVSFHV